MTIITHNAILFSSEYTGIISPPRLKPNATNPLKTIDNFLWNNLNCYTYVFYQNNPKLSYSGNWNQGKGPKNENDIAEVNALIDINHGIVCGCFKLKLLTKRIHII